MQIRVSQLQNQHRLVVDAVNAFFGMHSDQAVDHVEDELRQVRKGRLVNRDF